MQWAWAFFFFFLLRETPFQITQEEVAINTALQLSISGGYSHFPISLSSARQTDHRPDKHNHSRRRFREHLSAGKKVKKMLHTLSVKHLFTLNTQLSAAHYSVMIVLLNSPSLGTLTEITE